MTSLEHEKKKARHIRESAKKAIEDGKVKFVIGYQDGTYGGRVQPSFAESADDCERLTWGPGCTHNLSVYLMDDKRKPLKRGEEPDRRPIGIVVKGCDSMAIIELLKEHIVTRDEVFLIGVECHGIVDHDKVLKALKEKDIGAKAILDLTLQRDGEDLIMSFGEEEQRVPFKELALDKCLECTRHRPLIYDVLAGADKAPLQPPLKEGPEDDANEFTDVEEIEAMSLEERWEYWSKELGKCIRCYACRSACPLCYCEQCVVDPSDLSLKPQTSADQKARRPIWIDKNNEASETLFYHIVRAFHNAGRCIDCGECERACPMDIPLRKLTNKLRKDMKELFGYESGKDPAQKPALAMVHVKDPGDYVR